MCNYLYSELNDLQNKIRHNPNISNQEIIHLIEEVKIKLTPADIITFENDIDLSEAFFIEDQKE
uniref:Uncharacterized protein n=4 Tax=Vibrio TaxID=662 RepID=A0A0H3ZU66_9VIBR|nr:hypothetical protein [Vibrio sp. ZF_53]AKN37414.1 hypothetical protein [Vibrio tasmaniensis]AKN39334.1 hypothetical protein [Vibrio sp. ZF_45]AKN39742.1 hypothetical protein [Vibrio splendidus]